MNQKLLNQKCFIKRTVTNPRDWDEKDAKNKKDSKKEKKDSEKVKGGRSKIIFWGFDN